MATKHMNAAPGDFAETVLMPGDPVRAQYIADTYFDNARRVTDVRNMWGFTGEYKGQPISVMSHGMGIPSASIYCSELISTYGVKRIMRVGSCGTSHADVKLRDLIIAQGASTDSNVNRIRFGGYDLAALASFDLVQKAVQAAEAQDVRYHVGNIFSADLFYTPDHAMFETMVKYAMNLSAINVSSRMPDLSAGSRIDEVGINERVARFQSRSIKTASKVEALRLVLSMIDLTTLEGQDTAGKVGQLCQKAIHLHDAIPGLPHVAAVCVYPTMVGVARQALEGHDIKVASVATAFPSGMASLAVKLDDTKVAVEQGANEIDMVISRGAFLQGEYGRVFDEIATVKDACGDAHLKVILETGELGTLDRVQRASMLAMHAGADFIKTSTGKIQPAATMQVTLVMLQAIKDFYYKTGRIVGMKPAGGISKAKLAIHYLVMLRETLGNAWMTPEWFRFGASSLANDVLMQLMKQATGVYQSADYFSKD